MDPQLNVEDSWVIKWKIHWLLIPDAFAHSKCKTSNAEHGINFEQVLFLAEELAIQFFSLITKEKKKLNIYSLLSGTGYIHLFKRVSQKRKFKCV